MKPRDKALEIKAMQTPDRTIEEKLSLQVKTFIEQYKIENCAYIDKTRYFKFYTCECVGDAFTQICEVCAEKCHTGTDHKLLLISKRDEDDKKNNLRFLTKESTNEEKFICECGKYKHQQEMKGNRGKKLNKDCFYTDVLKVAFPKFYYKKETMVGDEKFEEKSCKLCEVLTESAQINYKKREEAKKFGKIPTSVLDENGLRSDLIVYRVNSHADIKQDKDKDKERTGESKRALSKVLEEGLLTDDREGREGSGGKEGNYENDEDIKRKQNTIIGKIEAKTKPFNYSEKELKDEKDKDYQVETIRKESGFKRQKLKEEMAGALNGKNIGIGNEVKLDNERLDSKRSQIHSKFGNEDETNLLEENIFGTVKVKEENMDSQKKLIELQMKPSTSVKPIDINLAKEINEKRYNEKLLDKEQSLKSNTKVPGEGLPSSPIKNTFQFDSASERKTSSRQHTSKDAPNLEANLNNEHRGSKESKTESIKFKEKIIDKIKIDEIKEVKEPKEVKGINESADKKSVLSQNNSLLKTKNKNSIIKTELKYTIENKENKQEHLETNKTIDSAIESSGDAIDPNEYPNAQNNNINIIETDDNHSHKGHTKSQIFEDIEEDEDNAEKIITPFDADIGGPDFTCRCPSDKFTVYQSKFFFLTQFTELLYQKHKFYNFFQSYFLNFNFNLLENLNIKEFIKNEGTKLKQYTRPLIENTSINNVRNRGNADIKGEEELSQENSQFFLLIIKCFNIFLLQESSRFLVPYDLFKKEFNLEDTANYNYNYINILDNTINKLKLDGSTSQGDVNQNDSNDIKEAMFLIYFPFYLYIKSIYQKHKILIRTATILNMTIHQRNYFLIESKKALFKLQIPKADLDNFEFFLKDIPERIVSTVEKLVKNKMSASSVNIPIPEDIMYFFIKILKFFIKYQILEDNKIICRGLVAIYEMMLLNIQNYKEDKDEILNDKVKEISFSKYFKIPSLDIIFEIVALTLLYHNDKISFKIINDVEINKKDEYSFAYNEENEEIVLAARVFGYAFKIRNLSQKMSEYNERMEREALERENQEKENNDTINYDNLGQSYDGKNQNENLLNCPWLFFYDLSFKQNIQESTRVIYDSVKINYLIKKIFDLLLGNCIKSNINLIYNIINIFIILTYLNI